MINDSLRPENMSSSKWAGIFDKVKEYLDDYYGHSQKIRYLKRHDLTTQPDALATEMGAYFSDTDSRRDIRFSMKLTPSLQRAPGDFQIWKKKIDRITAGDSQLYRGSLLQGRFTIGQSRVAEQDLVGVGSSDLVPTLFPGFAYVDLNMGGEPSAEIIARLKTVLLPLKFVLPITIIIGVIRLFGSSGLEYFGEICRTKEIGD